MKKVFLTAFAFASITATLQAQSIFDKAAEDAANVICNCVNKTYKSMDDILADESGEKGISLQECMEANTEKMKSKYENLEEQPGFSDEMMFTLMLEKLASKEKCALASMLMEMGKNADNTEETVEDEEEGSDDE